MKKTFIFIFIFILALGVIPIVGNQIIEETLDKKIAKLETKGLEVLKKEKTTGYLNTSRHYEFIENEIKYGLDLQYSNIPFTEDVILDIYPLSAPKSFINDLKNKDKAFASYLEEFLQNKGVLYHMEYNLISGDFNGYVKDIDEKYTMSNKSRLKVKVIGTTFKGNGDLRSPSTLQTSSKKINLEVEDVQEQMVLDVSNMSLKASSNFTQDKAQLHSTLHFDDIYLKSNTGELNASTFNYDVNVSNIDKKAYKAFLSSKKSENSTIKLLSKGVDIDVKDFSLKNVVLNKEDLNGFIISSDMQLEADKNLAFKINLSPLLALSNLDIDFKSKVSKKIIDAIIKDSLIPNSFIQYQTSSGDDMVFDLSYKQGSLVINGKTIL